MGPKLVHIGCIERNYLLGREKIKYSGWQNDKVIRLIRKEMYANATEN